MSAFSKAKKFAKKHKKALVLGASILGTAAILYRHLTNQSDGVEESAGVWSALTKGPISVPNDSETGSTVYVNSRGWLYIVVRMPSGPKDLKRFRDREEYLNWLNTTPGGAKTLEKMGR